MNNPMRLAILASIMLVAAMVVYLIPIDNNAIAQQTTPFPSREKVISVTGTATTSVDPDLLIIQFGVETQEKTAKEALESNSQLMSNVIQSIKAPGILEEELSTSRLNIQPIYDYYEEPIGKRTQELVGYRVSNILNVETGQLDKAADIIDSAVSAGVNRIDNVYFTLSPTTQLAIKDNLIEQAILNAKSKAEKALTPLNHEIIGVKAISLSDFVSPYPQPMYDFAESAIMAKAVSTPVFSSDQDVTTTANVIFLIGT